MRYKGRVGFDKIKDMAEVEQFGYINLAQAYANGVVEGSANPDQLSFNQIEDPASIMGKPSDEFEAINMRSYVRKTGVEKKDGE